MRSGCEKVLAGEMAFGGVIDITDPCYRKKTRSRMNDVAIVPGTYACVAYVKDTGPWGKRVATAGIYLNGIIPKVFDMKSLGIIGVDSGMAGFFSHKPDFTDDQWNEFCALTDSLEYPCVCLNDTDLFRGFLVSSGYGDGGYPVYVARNEEGRLVALELRFM